MSLFFQSEPLSQLPLGITSSPQLYSLSWPNNRSGAASRLFPSFTLEPLGLKSLEFRRHRGCSCANDNPYPTKSCGRRGWDPCGAGYGIIGNHSRDLFTSSFFGFFWTTFRVIVSGIVLGYRDGETQMLGAFLAAPSPKILSFPAA